MERYSTCLCRQSILVRDLIFGNLNASAAGDSDSRTTIGLDARAFDSQIYFTIDIDRPRAEARIETIRVIMPERPWIRFWIVDSPVICRPPSSTHCR